MKHLLMIIFVLLSFSGWSKSRKISNSNYFRCTVEREGKDQKNYSRQYLFPFPADASETYELKASLRWNSLKVLFDHKGHVEAWVSEKVGGKKAELSKVLDLSGDPQTQDFKMDLPLDTDPKIIYHLQCGPE